MSELYTVNRALINAGTLPLPQGVLGGELKTLIDTYTVVGVVAIEDTIESVKLPIGAKVVGIKLKWIDMSTSASCGVLVGDSVDPDRYYKAGSVDLSALGVIDNIEKAGIGHKVGVASDLGVPAEDRAIILTTELGVLLEGSSLTMIVSYV